MVRQYGLEFGLVLEWCVEVGFRDLGKGVVGGRKNVEGSRFYTPRISGDEHGYQTALKTV